MLLQELERNTDYTPSLITQTDLPMWDMGAGAYPIWHWEQGPAYFGEVTSLSQECEKLDLQTSPVCSWRVQRG